MTASINLQEVVRPSWFSETNHHRNVPGRPSSAGYGRDSDRLSQSVVLSSAVIQLQSWLSLFGACTLFSIGCICLFYEITIEIPWFRVISRIPFQVGNSANSASFPRSRKITGPNRGWKYNHTRTAIFVSLFYHDLWERTMCERHHATPPIDKTKN